MKKKLQVISDCSASCTSAAALLVWRKPFVNSRAPTEERKRLTSMEHFSDKILDEIMPFYKAVQGFSSVHWKKYITHPDACRARD